MSIRYIIIQIQMLVKKLIPLKFLGLMIEIVLSSLILATKGVYPAVSSTTTDATFIAGCSLILVFSFIQIVFTLSGINIFNLRIHFENLVCSWFACLLLAWFCFGLWPREYVWLIWGFLCIYPLLNELFGMISNICHNKKLVFQKYRSDN